VLARSYAALLVYLVSFAAAEGLGILTYRHLLCQGVQEAHATAIFDLTVSSFRITTLYMILSASGYSILRVIYKPLPSKAGLLLALGLLCLVVAEDYFSSILVAGSYSPQLADLGYYLKQGFLAGYPLKLLYYFSEIMALNSLYIIVLDSLGGGVKGFAGSLLVLIILWALPHALTKSSPYAAVDAVLFVGVAYAGFFVSSSPVLPVMLWFAKLVA